MKKDANTLSTCIQVLWGIKSTYQSKFSKTSPAAEQSVFVQNLQYINIHHHSCQISQSFRKHSSAHMQHRGGQKLLQGKTEKAHPHDRLLPYSFEFKRCHRSITNEKIKDQDKENIKNITAIREKLMCSMWRRALSCSANDHFHCFHCDVKFALTYQDTAKPEVTSICGSVKQIKNQSLVPIDQPAMRNYMNSQALLRCQRHWRTNKKIK